MNETDMSNDVTEMGNRFSRHIMAQIIYYFLFIYDVKTARPCNWQILTKLIIKWS